MNPSQKSRNLPRHVVSVAALCLLLSASGLSAGQTDGSIIGWGQRVVVGPENQIGLIAVAAGSDHSLGLKAGGSLVAWGRNYEYQCSVPAPNSGFAAVAAGPLFSLGLRAVVEAGACCHGHGCSDAESEAECLAQAFRCDIADYLPASFAGCYGDVDGNGVVNPRDRGFVAANMGLADPVFLCRFDMDGNGFINAGDRGFIAANIDLCTPLPEYQNGSGLNHGAPDTRFGTTTFMGVGTTCATVACP